MGLGLNVKSGSGGADVPTGRYKAKLKSVENDEKSSFKDPNVKEPAVKFIFVLAMNGKYEELSMRHSAKLSPRSNLVKYASMMSPTGSLTKEDLNPNGFNVFMEKCIGKLYTVTVTRDVRDDGSAWSNITNIIPVEGEVVAPLQPELIPPVAFADDDIPF